MSALMEDPAVKDQSSASDRSTSRLLRYPLRSATKAKEEKQPLTDSSNSASALKRGKAASSVSKSVGVLDVSGKEKSAKPPRRFSIPSKTNASPAPKPFGNITPISEAKRTTGTQGKSDTPVSDISKSSNRKKFCVLSSASYWLSQIKLSESAAKHSISLGFFKLALEAGCEPIQRMSDELRSYVNRYNLSELGEVIKELFERYKISENTEQSQVSQVPAEGNQLSDDDIGSSSSSVIDAEKLKPKTLDVGADDIRQVKKPTSKTSKKGDAAKKTRISTKNAASLKSGSEVRGRSTQKKPRKPIKQEPKQGKKTAAPEEGPIKAESEEALRENKENMDAAQIEEST